VTYMTKKTSLEELRTIDKLLDEMGVDAERKEFVDGTKKVMIDGLKEKHSAGRAPQHFWEIGPTGAENFDYFIDKYK